MTGRPVKPTARRARFELRLEPDELERWRQAAELAGEPLAAFVRTAVERRAGDVAFGAAVARKRRPKPASSAHFGTADAERVFRETLAAAERGDVEALERLPAAALAYGAALPRELVDADAVNRAAELVRLHLFPRTDADLECERRRRRRHSKPKT